MRSDREIIESYIPVAKYISMLLGPNAEVAVHDFTDITHSIIYISNGYITGRKEGDGLRNFALAHSLEHIYKGMPFTERIPYDRDDVQGRKIYSSAFYIHNDSGDVVGFLGVVEDLSGEILIQNRLNSLLGQHSVLVEQDEIPTNPNSTANVVDVMIASCLGRMNRASPQDLHKDEKISVIEEFEKQNLFAIRGVVKLVAQRLKISEPSVYRYLRELREGVEREIEP